MERRDHCRGEKSEQVPMRWFNAMPMDRSRSRLAPVRRLPGNKAPRSL